MMALHVEIPGVPGRDVSRTQEATRPPRAVPPRLDCSSQDLRQANDYVRTPCHLTPADPAPHLKCCVHYSAQSTTGGGQLVFAEVVAPDLKDAEPRLPSKQNGSGSGASACVACGGSSDFCPRCHRCRCEKYREEPRELPWCCSCECCGCSPEQAVDYATCMCCVRGGFYHCCEDAEEENDYTDYPCGCCDYPRCFLRWLFVVIFTLFLPCLLFYWPFRGALALATCCYNCSRSSRGCRCKQELPVSRPLIEAENASV